MNAWLDTLLQGMLLGGLYALYAAGLSLVFGVMRIVNLAHGDLIVLAAYVALAMISAFGPHPLAATVVTAGVMFGLGYFLQLWVLNRAIGGGILRTVLVTFGISVILQNALLMIATPDTRKIDAGAIETLGIALGPDIRVGVFPLITFALAIAVIGSVQWMIYHTRLGRAFRALSDDPATAQLVGIDTRKILALATALALSIAGIAGVCMGIRTNFDPLAGSSRLLFGFEAVIVGGLGSLWGTLVGGIFIGISQAIGARIDPDWQILGGHLGFLLVLAIRPSGFMARRADA